jgi:hypothetical protein
MESDLTFPPARGTKYLQLMILGGDLYLERLRFSLCASCFCVTRPQAVGFSVPKEQGTIQSSNQSGGGNDSERTVDSH